MLRILCFLIMINPTVLSARLAGLVGFRQPYNPAYQILDAANLASRSGYFVTDNPFVKIETIKDSQDYAGILDADFNAYLKNRLATSAVNVANAVFSQNDYIDRQLIYKYALNKYSQNPTGSVDQDGKNVYTYDLPAGFICYWLQPSQEKDLAFKIERVFLEFAGTGDITLYLYNTANLKTPLQTKTVTVTNPCQEVLLDWVCDNAASGKGYKGDYYLGYFSEGMVLKPFQRQYRNAVAMSDISDLNYIRSQFPTFTDPSKEFDLMGFSSYIPYNGINPDITVYEDFTDLIIQNEKLFARAIMLDAQIAFLSESIASVRSNRNERISEMSVAKMMTQIEGETGEGNVKVKGLRPQFYGAIGSIKKELDKLRTGYQGEGLIMVQTMEG